MNALTPTRLATLFQSGRVPLLVRYDARLNPHQRQATPAILACPSGRLGSLGWACPACPSD